jgi:glycerol-3-phosphate O-acyltransferase/dihydroxyacetone phosphate acyltransferase
MAASSYSKPVVGQIAKSLNVIPVSRPEDSKKKGIGKIILISPTLIKGIHTNFIEETKSIFSNGVSAILIGNKSFLVDKILDLETIIIKENKEEGKTVILNKEYDYFYLPKIDNSILFRKVYNRLNEDGCICIFPEGTSHDRTEFIKLKAGIALMTLGAMSQLNCKNVKIIPVGLNYFKREEFRSEVIIEFGKPFEVPREWADSYKINKRESTEKLLLEIEAVII